MRSRLRWIRSKDLVNELGRFFQEEDRRRGTHLALRWNGRVRFTVPREKAAQQVCWKTFRPGRLEIPLRAIAHLPRMLGADSCVEGPDLVQIRGVIGADAGLSCCRTGTEGVWSKDTILFLNREVNPIYIVKAGAGKAVNALLENEAGWLKRFQGQSPLANHIPEFVVHRSGVDISFVAQRALTGNIECNLGKAQMEFLQAFQEYSIQLKQYEDSNLRRTLTARLMDLHGLLTDAWATRLDKAMRKIEESLSRSPIQFVAAHNDFALWNIRVECGVARVFDWEYAADEQLPLFDPLHFALMPMALKRAPTGMILEAMSRTIQLCRQWFGEERCQQAEAQSLAYLVNLCTLYLWADEGQCTQHPVLVCYAHIIDRACHLPQGV